MNEQLAIPLPTTFLTGLPERAQRIRSLVTVARGCIIEIGRELIAAKAEVAHGGWLDWLKDEFGWGETTARKYMQVAGAFKSSPSEDFTGLTIDATALYALSAPDVPQVARDTAIEQAQDGKQITKAEADRIIADAEHRIGQEFTAQLQRIRSEAEAKAADTIAAAEMKFSRNRAALEAEIKRLTEAGELPGVADVVDALCKYTGQDRLTPKQFSLVAQALNTAITDGTRVYQPVSEEVVKQMEVNLQISGAMVRALEYFAGAPSPTEAWNACPAPLRDAAQRNAKAASIWLTKFQSVLKKEAEDAGSGGV